MKIPITDQFLWDVYGFLEEAGDIAGPIFRARFTMRDMLPGPKDPTFDKYRKIRNRQRFNKMIYYLKKNNFIKVKNLQNKQAILLTRKGIDKALRASFNLETEKPAKRKDGKWAMIIYDIPKNDKKQRDLLRSILKNLGYKIFQYSVWVTPYDVSEKTEKLLQFYSLDRYVKIFLIEGI